MSRSRAGRKALDDEGRRPSTSRHRSPRGRGQADVHRAVRHAGAGVSRALSSPALERRATELGYSYLVLETGLAQPEAIALYGADGLASASPPTATTGSRRSRSASPRTAGGRRWAADAMSEAGRHAVLVGPTASGKSALALELARQDATWELVSVDSMQVYRGMDIGTAKPTAAEQAEVRHHLLDLLDPWEDGTVAWFQQQARADARGHRAARPPRAAGRRDGALRASRRGRPRDPRAVPGRARPPRVGPRHERAPCPARGARPCRGGSHGADQPPTDPPRPGGDDGERTSLLQLRPRSRRPPADRVHHGRAPSRQRRASASGSRLDTPRRWTLGSSTRCGDCAPSLAASRAPPVRPWGTRSCYEHLDGSGHPRRGARPRHPPHRSVRPPTGGLVPS